ncbi:BBT_HP_G0104640.mRNA.1.CDS.1 [Saccharomyces cerevisiae]|nr:BBT_HP_G0063880.mRNA.1.CDS.1 [Saccharomyces cerevisiae]CAI4992281.1 BBT_HP_G0073400.mRNA.1.CDS.1 [Saccharomyces cerevisiae]CAI5027686.1 BBT_HP_G0104640.mRNA.1.CDS.1 [Saccharomyces cerevisiae]CAI6787874.1 BBT_HP_G0063880.mRNA.1.CDS.1 [Saccharomyces cerevisiae]CAI6865232.1 BBT_HP_G0073400.mRNA.1.CDS.1 [Saccharomyces cerevisiae]
MTPKESGKPISCAMKKLKGKRSKILVLSRDAGTNELKPTKGRAHRACIACRKRKVRCSGNIPCRLCQTNSYECKYDRPPRNSSVFDREVSDDSSLYAQRASHEREDSKGPISSIDYKKVVETIFPPETLRQILASSSFNSQNFLDTIKTCLLQGQLNVNQVIRQSLPKDTPWHMQTSVPLPPREIALKFIQKTWDCACVLFRFYHRPTIISILDSIYEAEKHGKQYTPEQVKTQPLIYSVLAVGALFSKEDLSKDSKATREFYTDEGYRYFLEAKNSLDFSNITDIYSIQAIFMMTIFLQCSANLKACYSFIGIALRAALKEGLHRRSSIVGPTPIQDETKKRLFWSVYKLDLYMNCILGFPSGIDESDIDQEFPLDVDDENISTIGIKFQDRRTISSCGMNNKHTKLILIMSRIYKLMYSLRRKPLEEDSRTQIVSLNDQLDNWYAQLPDILKVDTIRYRQTQPPLTVSANDSSSPYTKPKKLLYLDFLLSKIVLYKPFYHYISIDPLDIPEFQFQIHMAENCIEVAKKVIQLSYEMITQNLLSGSYWFSIHTIFFSVACLKFYVYQTEKGLIRNGKVDSDIYNATQLGSEILSLLKGASNASKRTFEVLNQLFKEFNEKTSVLSEQLLNIVKLQRQESGGALVPQLQTNNNFTKCQGELHHGQQHHQTPATSLRSILNLPQGEADLKFQNTNNESHTTTAAQEEYLDKLLAEFEEFDYSINRVLPDVIDFSALIGQDSSANNQIFSSEFSSDPTVN